MDKITDYWFSFYQNGHCTLCGNSGVIDTRATAVTAAGLPTGRLNWCICPNGQALRANQAGKLPAADYAVSRLPGGPHVVQSGQLAGFELIGRRQADGRLRIGLDPAAEIVDDWPQEARLPGINNVYTLEEVKTNGAPKGHAGEGIEWGTYA